MKRYKIALVSKDGHGYEYQCYAKERALAELQALDHMNEIGYTHYEYRVKYSEEMIKPNLKES